MKPNIELLKNDVLSMLEENLPKDLFYHDKNHTIEVYEASSKYANMERVPKHEKNLIMTASLLLYTGFTRRYNNNNELAVEIAESLLPDYGFVNSEKEIIYEMIRSIKIPQNPKTLLQKIICDSDMDHLGRLNFLLESDLLRGEWQIHRKKVCTDKEWYRLQLKFLENHQYFTNSAKKLRGKGKIENIKKLKKRI